MGKELANLVSSHGGRMSYTIKKDEASDPAHIGLLGEYAVVFEAALVSHLVE